MYLVCCVGVVRLVRERVQKRWRQDGDTSEVPQLIFSLYYSILPSSYYFCKTPLVAVVGAGVVVVVKMVTHPNEVPDRNYWDVGLLRTEE